MTLALLTLNTLPWGGIVPLVLLCVVGLLLWAAGRRVLRAGLAAIGLLLGFALGWAGGVQVDLGVSPWVPAVIGAAVLACLAALTYRLAVAAALAIVLGLAAPLMVLTLGPYARAEQTAAANGQTTAPAPQPLSERLDEFTRWLQSYDEEPEEAATPGSILGDLAADELGLSEANQERLEQGQRIAEHLGEEARSWWAEAPPPVRSRMVFAAVVGALLGILLGTLAPHACASGVTAFGGSLLWMSSLRLMLVDLSPAAIEWLPDTAPLWLGIWFGVAFIGLAIQWMIRRPRADKSG